MKNKKIKNKRIYTDDGIISGNGIAIGGDIAFSAADKLNSNYFLPVQILISLISITCTMSMICQFLGCTELLSEPLIFSTLLAAALTLIFAGKGILRLIGWIYLAIHILILIPFLNAVRVGFYVIVDWYTRRADQVNSLLGSKLAAYASDPEIDLLYCASCFLVIVATVVTLLVCLSCIFRIDFPLLFVATFPFMELGLYWGWETSSWTIIGLVICWIMVLSLHIINHTTNKAGRNNTFAIHRRRSAYYLTSDKIKKRFFATYARAMAILCVLIFSAAMIFSSVTGFVRPREFKQMRSDISDAVSNFSMNSISNMLEDYEGGLNIFKVKTVGGINGGLLGRTDSISFNGSTALKVSAKVPQTVMYLRGYVAGNYTDNSWTELEEVSGSDERLKIFTDNGCCPQDYNYLLSDLVIESGALQDGLSIEDSTIEVKVVGASKKFVYAPYMTYYSSDSNSGDDRMLPQPESYVSLRKKEYKLTYRDIEWLSPSWNGIISALAGNGYTFHVNYKGLYTDFVRENYMKYERSDALDEAFDNIADNYLGYSVSDYSEVSDPSEIISAVSDYFSDNYTYDLSPGKTPSGEDFIDYFLTEQKEGYCSYFASAGVMLMRMFGYPARFVEGYVVQPSQFVHDINSSYGTATVSDRAAHAWCEIFIENVGWVPCEFTPGYNNANPNLTDRELHPQSAAADDSSHISDDNSSSAAPNEDSSHNTSESGFGSSESGESSVSDTDSSSVSSDTDTSSVSESDSSSRPSAHAATSAGSGGGSGASGGKGNSGGSGGYGTTFKNTAVYTALAYAAGLLVIAAVVIIRRKSALAAMKKSIENADNSEAVKSIYKYYLKYLSLLSVSSRQNITDLQAAEELIKQCNEKGINISEEDIMLVTNSAVEAFLSGKQLTDDESDACRKALERLSENVVFNRLSAAGRFTATWVYNLY